MEIKKPTFAMNAWSALRMALIWAKKGGALRRYNQKRLKANDRTYSNRLRCFERQFSIDETPVFHFKMHRLASLRWISCVYPSVNEFDDYENERDFFKWDRQSEVCCEYEETEEKCMRADEFEKDIDSKADEFIAQFYDQMKMQRQISFLQYNEMIERSL